MASQCAFGLPDKRLLRRAATVRALVRTAAKDGLEEEVDYGSDIDYSKYPDLQPTPVSGGQSLAATPERPSSEGQSAPPTAIAMLAGSPTAVNGQGHRYQPVVWAAPAVPATAEMPAAVPAAVPAAAGTLLQRGAPVQEGAPAPVPAAVAAQEQADAAQQLKAEKRLKRKAKRAALAAKSDQLPSRLSRAVAWQPSALHGLLRPSRRAPSASKLRR